MRFTHNEKRLLSVVTALALVIGLCGGYLSYLDGAEAQFHGGVLEEDASRAFWALVHDAVVGFIKSASVAIFIFGIVPLAVWRLVAARGRGEV